MIMNVSRQARSAGNGEADSRRPIGYWAEFNNWWRTRLSEYGCRPTPTELAQWFNVNAPLCWRPEEMPSLQEVRTHAKCLRSTEQVRNYFRKYRAARKASSASVRCRTGSDSDSEEAAPTESISMSASAYNKTSRSGQTTNGAGKAQDPGVISHPSHASAVTTGADTCNLLPFVFGHNGGAGIFLAGAGGALAGLAALKAAAAAGSTAAVAAVAAAMPCDGGQACGGTSSPRSFKPSTSACSGPMHVLSQQPCQSQNNSGRYIMNGGGAGAFRHQAPSSAANPAAAGRPAVPLPPVAATVSGPVISFSSGGQPQHSAHGPGQARSIGGGIVLRLPSLQRTNSTGGGCGGGSGPIARALGSTPTKHSSPAPPAPAAKRQAIAQPACSSGQTSSIHLGGGEYGGAYPAPYACMPSVSGTNSLGPTRQTAAAGNAAVAATSAACFPPTVTSGMRESRNLTPPNAVSAAAPATRLVGLPAAVNGGMAGATGYFSALSSCPSAAHHAQYAPNAGLHTFNPSASAAYAPNPARHPSMLDPSSNVAAGSAVAMASTMAAAVASAARAATSEVAAAVDATAVLSSLDAGPAGDEIACDAGALSPTQAFFHAWHQNDVYDLLIDLPGDADGGCGSGGGGDLMVMPARQEVTSVATAAAAGRAVDVLALEAPDAVVKAEDGGGTAGSMPALPHNMTCISGATAATANGRKVKMEDDGCGGSADANAMDFFAEETGKPKVGYGGGDICPGAQLPLQVKLAASLDPQPQQLLDLQLQTSLSQQHPPQSQSQRGTQEQQHEASLARENSTGADVNATLRWWPDPNGGVGSGLPPIRTTLQGEPAASRSKRLGNLQQLPTPNAAAASQDTEAVAVNVNVNAAPSLGGAGEGLSPASTHELFAMLDLAQLQIPPVVTKLSGRHQQQQQPQANGPQVSSQQQHDSQGANATSEPSSHSEGTAHRGGAYPSMHYSHAWPAPYLGAPDAAAAVMSAAPPAMSHGPTNAPADPYQSSMCLPYPYPSAGSHYAPYGYCPSPYGLLPHHPYYYHQMPLPPPSGSGYDMYGWSPYHLPQHAITYPGVPYHGYPMTMGPMMPPPPQQLTHGSTADCPSSGVGAMGSNHLEASSVRVRAARQGSAASGGGGGGGAAGTFMPPGTMAAEPLMPGRYVWQATGGSGLSKIRRTVSGQGVTECGECNTSGGTGGGGGGGGHGVAATNDAVSTMHSHAAPAVSGARTRTVAQGSYCSNVNQCYSQSIGGAHMQAVIPTGQDIVACGGAGSGGENEECAESRNCSITINTGGREVQTGGPSSVPGTAMVAVAETHQLMPPPPPRQPKPERVMAVNAPACSVAEKSHTAAPPLPPGLSSLPLPLPLEAPNDTSLHAFTYTPATDIHHNITSDCAQDAAGSSFPPPTSTTPTSDPPPPSLPLSMPSSAAAPPSGSLPPFSDFKEHGANHDSPLLLHQAAHGTFTAAAAATTVAAVAETSNTTAQRAAATVNGLSGSGESATAMDTAVVYVCDDSDLLDLSSITAGLFSPPGSQVKRAPSASRGAGSRATAPLTATAAAAAVAAAILNNAPPNHDATPNNSAAVAAASTTFAFTPVSACTVSRSHAFAAPPRALPQLAATSTLPAAAAGAAAAVQQPSDPSSLQKCPLSARSTDFFRALATPRTLCGSPLDCSLLASWLTSPAGMTSLDGCTRPLGLILGPLDEDGDVSTRPSRGEQEDGCLHICDREKAGEGSCEDAMECRSKPATANGGDSGGRDDGRGGAAVGAKRAEGAMEQDMEEKEGEGEKAGSGCSGCDAQPPAMGDDGSGGIGDGLRNVLCSPVDIAGTAGAAARDSATTDGARDSGATAGAALPVAPQVPDLTAHIRITYVPPSSTATSARANSSPCTVSFMENPGFGALDFAVIKSLSGGDHPEWNQQLPCRVVAIGDGLTVDQDKGSEAVGLDVVMVEGAEMHFQE